MQACLQARAGRVFVHACVGAPKTAGKVFERHAQILSDKLSADAAVVGIMELRKWGGFDGRLDLRQLGDLPQAGY